MREIGAQITADYAEKMRSLCAKADVITPNLTEAALLLGLDYNDEPGESTVHEMLKDLIRLGAKSAVITGITRGKEIGFTAYDGANFYEIYSEKQNLLCMGTGDVFSSAMLAAIVLEKSFEQALEIAAKFTAESVRKTAADPDRRFYGVNFEQALPLLIELLGNYS